MGTSSADIYQPSKKTPAQIQTQKNYLDGGKFTALFKTNTGNRNRRRIAEGLYLIAHNLACTFDGSREVLEDAASEAMLYALQRLHLFDHRRPGASAFNFFSSVIRNRINERVSLDRRRESRMKLMVNDQHDGVMRTTWLAEIIERRRVGRRGARQAMEIRLSQVG